MKHLAAFCAGWAIAMTGLFIPYLVLILHCCQGAWDVYVCRCVLTTAAYALASVTGGTFGRCASAYLDLSAEVTGYCHPVRERVR